MEKNWPPMESPRWLKVKCLGEGGTQTFDTTILHEFLFFVKYFFVFFRKTPWFVWGFLYKASIAPIMCEDSSYSMLGIITNPSGWAHYHPFQLPLQYGSRHIDCTFLSPETRICLSNL